MQINNAPAFALLIVCAIVIVVGLVVIRSEFAKFAAKRRRRRVTPGDWRDQPGLVVVLGLVVAAIESQTGNQNYIVPTIVAGFVIAVALGTMRQFSR